MSIDEKKEKTEWPKIAFERELENKYDIEIHNGMTCILYRIFARTKILISW